MSSVENTIPMRLRRAYLTMHRAAQAHFAQFGVTVDQYVLLAVLAEEEGVTQSDIGERMASDGNTIAAMLRLLEENGLIRRKQCEQDGRARRVYLTATGRRLEKRLARTAQTMHDRIDATMTATERKALFSILDRVAEIMSPQVSMGARPRSCRNGCGAGGNRVSRI